MKISLITVTYNSQATITDTLQSVAEQTYQGVEYIVIDGASTDGTLAALERFRSRINVCLSEPDGGPAEAQNKGIGLATGDVIGFLHSDDVLAHRDVLAKIAAAFASTARVDAVYGDLDYVRTGNTEKVLRHWPAGSFSPHKLKWGWMPPNPTLYVRKEHYERLGGVCANYKIASDYYLTLRLFSQPGFCPVYLPEVLVKMRWGGRSNESLANIIHKSRDDLRALRETGVGGWGTLLWKNLSKVRQFWPGG